MEVGAALNCIVKEVKLNNSGIISFPLSHPHFRAIKHGFDIAFMNSIHAVYF